VKTYEAVDEGLGGSRWQGGHDGVATRATADSMGPCSWLVLRPPRTPRGERYSAQLGALAPLIDWTSQMAGFWPSRFDHLEDLLKRMDQ
jgi:hypothetical protein